jgi:hypothetical protein
MRQLLCYLCTELSPICCIVRGNAGRPQITSIAFGIEMVIER